MVYAEKVNEINPYLIPKNVVLRPLYQYMLPDGAIIATTSPEALKKIPNKVQSTDYLAISKLFGTTTSVIVATSSRELYDSANFDFTKKKGLILKNKLALWQEGQNLYVEWLGDPDGVPYYFCNDEDCVTRKEILIDKEIGRFDFYGGRNNYILVALPDGIYVYEIDDRSSPQNKAVLVLGKGLDFRVSGTGVMYVKNREGIFVVDL
jgi:hypothetical protein